MDHFAVTKNNEDNPYTLTQVHRTSSVYQKVKRARTELRTQICRYRHFFLQQKLLPLNRDRGYPRATSNDRHRSGWWYSWFSFYSLKLLSDPGIFSAIVLYHAVSLITSIALQE